MFIIGLAGAVATTLFAVSPMENAVRKNRPQAGGYNISQSLGVL